MSQIFHDSATQWDTMLTNLLLNFKVLVGIFTNTERGGGGEFEYFYHFQSQLVNITLSTIYHLCIQDNVAFNIS
jgi:hypothetical protein